MEGNDSVVHVIVTGAVLLNFLCEQIIKSRNEILQISYVFFFTCIFYSLGK